MSNRYGACLGVSIVAVCLGAVAVSARALELKDVVVMKTGLLSVGPGNTFRAIVSEIGEAQTGVGVKIEFHSASGRVVASIERDLLPGQPVILDKRLPGDSGVVLLRATVTITASIGATTTPMTVLEELDVDNLIAVPKVVCDAGPGTPRVDAQLSCGGCGGFAVTRFTIAE